MTEYILAMFEGRWEAPEEKPVQDPKQKECRPKFPSSKWMEPMTLRDDPFCHHELLRCVPKECNFRGGMSVDLKDKDYLSPLVN